MENWVQILVSILSGLVALIPLVVKLIEYVKAATKEKNWSQMLKLVMNLMEQAEQDFKYGSEKKEWVMGQLEALSNTLNYDIDYDVVSDMIDKMCAMAKNVN